MMWGNIASLVLKIKIRLSSERTLICVVLLLVAYYQSRDKYESHFLSVVNQIMFERSSLGKMHKILFRIATFNFCL